ncbi:MAG: lysylphosphatidylglycerol synthase domain-containing protein [Ilumatobacteraceae bacterium]
MTVRLVGRSRSGSPIANWLVAQREQSIELLRGRWTRAIASGVFVSAARVALLVMCLRFMDVPESAISWQAIFAVWAIQRGLTIVPIMPGGAGVTELALTGLLAAIAGQEFINQITAGVLVFRLLTWLLMIPAGGVALGLWRVGLRKSGIDPDAVAAT